ncbi:phosphoribosylanthranilate isomerase [Robiginitalea sp. SC105]|uniref:phosphoribosylanthranilate isomerase n=1 Tax=Robiginitalea sp. SC105 TaxID=2762332 RepID=UPI00163A85A2|nr:phosphoribosylanthranilate isomerase [Robiginitalea sp. SC105]MBC2839115.1 phosphoribosylanthranilate isomerase [Robiginitalea sp. SC105]
MRLKVCGMKHNPVEIARLGPDYLGFIFWEGSSRNFEGELPQGFPEYPLRVGVFVDAAPGDILEKCRAFDLSLVQLHGQESAAYCRGLKRRLEETLAPPPRLIKAFSVGSSFDFGTLSEYREACDFFLFDSRGPLPGGNGTGFDWKVLENYPYETPFFLSGGIGPGSLDEIKDFSASPAGRFCYAIDVNSRFETAPGQKDAGTLKEFMDAAPWFQPGPRN